MVSADADAPLGSKNSMFHRLLLSWESGSTPAKTLDPCECLRMIWLDILMGVHYGPAAIILSIFNELSLHRQLVVSSVALSYGTGSWPLHVPHVLQTLLVN